MLAKNNRISSIDIMICNWHYERAEPTASYFALKGFDVATSFRRNGAVAKEQLVLLETRRKTPIKQQLNISKE